MHDWGGLVWIVLVLIGVVSSISKNARKARQQRQRQAPAPRPAPVRRIADIVITPPPPVPAPVVAPAQARREPERSVTIPSGAPVRPERPPVGTSPIRGMFEGPATLVRAIVAAEVLGPPKSMQEQSIWSPRHSEPSI